MENNLPLSGMTILDFSQRLPGPLAGKILGDMGATIIKVENLHWPDSFLSTLFQRVDGSFSAWYSRLNQDKEILRLDFQAPETLPRLQTLIKDCQGIIMGLPATLRQSLRLTREDLRALPHPLPLGVVEITSGADESLHDMNALALSGVLSLYTEDRREKILAPPFLPFAGIALGQNAATNLLACLWESLHTRKVVIRTSSLLQTVEQVFSPFNPPSPLKGPRKFLHNGAFPCYCLYRTRDGQYIAVAAVEEKYWTGICETFDLPLKGEERFRRDKEAFSLVLKKFLALSLEEIQNLAKDKNLCMTPVARRRKGAGKNQ